MILKDLIDELTPKLDIMDHVSARWDGTCGVIVSWYGVNLILDPTEIMLDSCNDIRQSILSNLDKNAPVTQKEIVERGGYLGYGELGPTIHIQRNHGCAQTLWTPGNFKNIVLSMPDPNDYKITMDGGLLAVESESYCPSSILTHGSWFIREILDDIYSIDRATTALLLLRPRGRVVIGHRTLISRLSEEMDSDYVIVKVISLEDLEGVG